MIHFKSFTHGIRSLFNRRPERVRIGRSRFRVQQAESLEQRQLLVVGAFAIPSAIQPGGQFSGVVRLTGANGGTASGVLLDDGLHVLTAAHNIPAFNGPITVQYNVLNNTGNRILTNVPISAQTVHPDYNSNPNAFDVNDIAILRLSEVAPAAATRYAPFTGTNELGQTITLAGYGRTGTGATGDTDPSGTLRSGMNQVSRITPLGREYRFDFDGSGIDTYNDGAGLGANEATTALGDSGGPSFINGAIAGVVSRGTATRTFGATTTHTRVSQFQDFIRRTQTAGSFDVIVNMNNQPGGGDGNEDQIVVTLNQAELQITVNGTTVFNTSSVEFGAHNMSMTNIASIQIIGSADREVVTLDERLGSLNNFSPFAPFGPYQGTVSMNLGSGTQGLVMGRWTNPFNRLDVNGDGVITPSDALAVINELNNRSFSSAGAVLMPPVWNNTTFLDVTRDGLVTPIDALLVINELNRRSNGGEGEAPTYPSTNLGTLNFRSLANASVSGTAYYEFTAANSGMLTIESFAGSSSSNVDLKLYRGAGLSPIATGSSSSVNERLDVSATAGERFTLEVTGINPGLNLRMNNLVNVSGSIVTVTGTSAADTLTVSTNGLAYSININGTTYSYIASSVSQISFNAGGGYDTATLTTSTARDTAYLYTSSYSISGSGYQLLGSQVESKRVISTGGSDYAYFYDSSGNDSFTAYSTHSYMSGSGFLSRTDDFYLNTAYSNAGGYDYSDLYDSSGDDVFIARDFASYLYGSSFYNYASGFNEVYAWGQNGGLDRAYFYDSIGNDHFVARSNYSSMSGSGFFNFQQGFDQVYLYGNNGGNNTLDRDPIDFLFYYYGILTLL